MDTRVNILNKAIKQYDRELFAERNSSRAICIMRKNFRHQKVLSTESSTLYSLMEKPDFVLALTDSWSLSGRPVEWGVDIVIQKLRGFDIWSNPDLIDEIDRDNERIDASEKRSRMNEHEAFIKDNAKQFQRAWSDIRYSNLDMSDSRRTMRDRNLELKGE